MDFDLLKTVLQFWRELTAYLIATSSLPSFVTIGPYNPVTGNEALQVHVRGTNSNGMIHETEKANDYIQ
jgi:hypothetical protein